MCEDHVSCIASKNWYFEVGEACLRGHLCVASLNVIFLDESFLSLCLRRHVAALCMLYKVNSNSNHCLFSELPSASVRIRQTRAVAAAGPLEFEVSK